MKRFPLLAKLTGVFLALILIFGVVATAKAADPRQALIDALYQQVLQLIVQVQNLIRARQLANYNQTIVGSTVTNSNQFSQKVPVTGIVNPASANPAPASTAVVIDSISPTEGGGGTTITLTGHGFKSSGNTVLVGGITYDNLSSSDGKTLTITLPAQLVNEDENFAPPVDPNPISGSELTPVTTGDTTIPLWIYLKTSDGFSNTQIFNFHV